VTPSAAPAGIGRGNPHQIAVWVDESVLANGAATVTIKLETAADEAFAVPIAVETSRPIPKAELLQGRDVFVTVIPPNAKQYIRLYYDVSAHGGQVHRLYRTAAAWRLPQVLPEGGVSEGLSDDQQDIASAVTEATGATKAEAAKAVAAVVDAIRDGLKRGEKVAVAGFGVFETAERGPSRARNLQTGEAIDVPAMTQVRFRPGKGLKDAVNGGR
jgi:DNA-binding protein HU-beta